MDETQIQSVSSVDRVPSGITGFDSLVAGGIPRGSMILVSGGCGTGKTNFCLQFLYHGAMHGEPGAFISLEDQPETLIRNADLFGWDLTPLIAQHKLSIHTYELYDFNKLRDSMDEVIDEMGAQRLVLDSSALLGLFFEDKYKFRRSLIELGKDLRQRDITTILTTEVPEGSAALSSFGVEEYAVDGVVLLSYNLIGNVYMRSLAIRKMRDTLHSMKVHPAQITPHGLHIYPTEEIF